MRQRLPRIAVGLKSRRRPAIWKRPFGRSTMAMSKLRRLLPVGLLALAAVLGSQGKLWSEVREERNANHQASPAACRPAACSPRQSGRTAPPRPGQGPDDGQRQSAQARHVARGTAVRRQARRAVRRQDQGGAPSFRRAGRRARGGAADPARRRRFRADHDGAAVDGGAGDVGVPAALHLSRLRPRLQGARRQRHAHQVLRRRARQEGPEARRLHRRGLPRHLRPQRRSTASPTSRARRCACRRTRSWSRPSRRSA